LVRRFWQTLEQRDSGEPETPLSPRTHHYGAFVSEAAESDAPTESAASPRAYSSSASTADSALHKSPTRTRNATVNTAALTDLACAREVHESLTALLLETGPYAGETSSMTMLVTLLGSDASNDLSAATVAVARRRGRDLALAAALLSSELVASLTGAGGALDDAGIRNALGSLLRGNSSATKVAREFLRFRCAPWLVRYVGGALGSSTEALEVDPSKTASPEAAASDLARLENLAQQVISSILLAGASELPDEAYILAHTVRNSVQFALDMHVRSLKRMSRREAFEASVATQPRGRRSSSAPRDRGRKLASRRIVVAAEVDRLRQQIGAGDRSAQTAAAMQRKELELTDIDRETDAIAVSPTTFLRESHFGQPEVRAYHVCMTGIVFLRFVCPALIAPHQNGLAPAEPSRAQLRTLTLLTKVIQQLANDVEFGRKESYMAPLSRMHQRNREPLRRFFVFLADEGQRRLARGGDSVPSGQYASFAASALSTTTSSHYQSLASVRANLPSAKLSCSCAGGQSGDADDLADVARLIGELRRHLKSGIDWTVAPYSSAQWQRVAVLIGARTDVSVSDAERAATMRSPPVPTPASAVPAEDSNTHYVELPVHLERRTSAPNPSAPELALDERASERTRKLERVRLLLSAKLAAVREQFDSWRRLALALSSVAEAMRNKKLLTALVDLKAVLPETLPPGAPFVMPPLTAEQAADAKVTEIVGKLLATLWLVDQRVVALQERVRGSLDKEGASAIAEIARRAKAIADTVKT
jgi:hypothetical protein